MAALTEEQSMIRDQAQSWSREQAPVSAFRKMRDSGIETAFDQSTWAQMVEMGWTGILVPEQYGGSDLGYLTFGIILEELGRQLTASPLFSSALVGASALLLGGNDAQKQKYLPAIVDGSQMLSLAVDEGPRHKPHAIKTTASGDDDGFTLNGNKTMVAEGLSATTFIVAAINNGSTQLFLVPSDAAGLSRSKLDLLDSRGYANVQLDNVRVDSDALLGQGGDDLLGAVLDRARAGLGMEILGTASQSFEMTVEYLKTRVQFGQVIGSFQGLSHRAAELFTEMELARSCAEAALQSIDAGSDDIAEMASLSKARLGEFVFHMSNELIQMHGGIGMTDEFDAGLYLKRARTLDAAYGNQAYHRERYAQLLGF